MVSLPGRSRRQAFAAEAFTSRLLPAMLDEQRLATCGTLNILDFGRADGASLEFFNRFSCRLCILDAAESLLAWSGTLEARREDPPSKTQMQLELSNLLSAMAGFRYDLVFLWDTVNHLPDIALPPFTALLRRHVTPNFRGHGFLMQKRGTAQQLRFMSLSGTEQVRVHEASDAHLYPHSRRLVNEALGRELAIDRGVLHNDGRLEFLMLPGSHHR